MDKKQQRKQKALRQKALLDAAKAANRDLTAEERAEFDALQRDIEALDAEIAQEDEQQRSLGGGTPASQPGTTPPPAPPAGGQDEAQRAIAAERSRIAEITTMCRDFGIEDAELRRYIEEGTGEDQVRAAILSKLKQDKPPLSTGVKVTGSGEDDFRRDAAEGLLIRGGVPIEKPSQGAQQFTVLTLRDLAVECLERSGVPNARYMSNDDLLHEVTRQFYNPTSAFPTILDNAINKAYVEGHRTAAVTFDRWTKRAA